MYQTKVTMSVITIVDSRDVETLFMPHPYALKRISQQGAYVYTCKSIREIIKERSANGAF